MLNQKRLVVKILGGVLALSIGFFSTYYIKERQIQNLKLELQNKERWNSQLENIITNKENEIADLNGQKRDLLNSLSDYENIIRKLNKFNQSLEDAPVFNITSYDLSIVSCGKPIGSRGYGETTLGINLINQNWKTAKLVACDPNIIPLGSVILIQFLDKEYSYMDGIYYNGDTGGGVKGNIIDLFYGDFNSNYESKEVSDFGVQNAKVLILN